MTERLPVLFRVIRGELLAIFPTLPHDYEGQFYTCYAHVGQHGACSKSFTSAGRLAKPEEYADLLSELRGIYEHKFSGDDEIYPLYVVKRTSGAHHKAFRAEVQRLAEVRA